VAAPPCAAKRRLHPLSAHAQTVMTRRARVEFPDGRMRMQQRAAGIEEDAFDVRTQKRTFHRCATNPLLHRHFFFRYAGVARVEPQPLQGFANEEQRAGNNDRRVWIFSHRFKSVVKH
jgi:hypothetical protein